MYTHTHNTHTHNTDIHIQAHHTHTHTHTHLIAGARATDDLLVWIAYDTTSQDSLRTAQSMKTMLLHDVYTGGLKVKEVQTGERADYIGADVIVETNTIS